MSYPQFLGVTAFSVASIVCGWSDIYDRRRRGYLLLVGGVLLGIVAILDFTNVLGE